MSSCTDCLPIEQADFQAVEQSLQLPDREKFSKQNLIKLDKIRCKYEGSVSKECFCSSVRRKIWFKEFTLWYEGYLRQAGHTTA